MRSIDRPAATDTGPLVAVAGGEVTLSDRRTSRRWTVTLAPYLLAAHPVTRQGYVAVTGDDPASANGGTSSGSDGGTGAGSDQAADLPVTEVSWWDAARYCNLMSDRDGLARAYQLDESRETAAWDPTADGYRLPTEAEWEHACRAGTTGPRYGDLDDIGWYRANSGERAHPVGGKQPNAWGLYDMLGNVWDWCWDHYDPQVYGTYRVLRGGGWCDEHWSCRASVRRRSHPTYRIDDVGFRLARNHPGASPAGA